LRSERRSRGSLEHAVLGTVAGSATALTPAEVRDRLGGDLAYTTVMTVMGRLAEKGLLVRERSGRGYAYASVTEAELTARQMQRLLDAQEDRAAVLARFVGALQPGDEAVLVELLARAGDEDEPPHQ
jgi:predicted transcriptional regulator